jgi:CofH subfamily radical SAM domain protein
MYAENKVKSNLLERVDRTTRISEEEIVGLYHLSAEQVCAAGHELRLQLTDPKIATYGIGGNIDYTNVCTVGCKFCAFYRGKKQEGAFTLTYDDIACQMREIVRIGGQDVLIQGGVNPELPMSWYLDMLRNLKRDFPQIHVDAFSPEEILGLEKLTGKDAYAILAEMKEAGLEGIPGAAAEILVDSVRERIAESRIRTGDWFRIMDAALRLQLHIPWISMVTGFGESLEDRAAHLVALRDQQDRSLDRYGHGFVAFKVWPARLAHTLLNGRVVTPTPEQIVDTYLREIAICRLALPNVVNHRAVWRTMGFGVAAQALRSGANDLCGTGSINAIDAAMVKAGKELPDPGIALLGDVKKCISSAGFKPAMRDPFYRVIPEQ